MKFRQKIALLFAIFYMASVVGLAAGLHFCGGQLSELRMFASAEGCDMCHSAGKKSDGCCKTTKVEVKVKDAHQGAISVKMPKIFGLELLYIPAFSDFVSHAREEVQTWSENKAPPLPSRLSLTILFQIFRN